jgi:hypothetical protein
VLLIDIPPGPGAVVVVVGAAVVVGAELVVGATIVEVAVGASSVVGGAVVVGAVVVVVDVAIDAGGSAVSSLPEQAVRIRVATPMVRILRTASRVERNGPHWRAHQRESDPGSCFTSGVTGKPRKSRRTFATAEAMR